MATDGDTNGECKDGRRSAAGTSLGRRHADRVLAGGIVFVAHTGEFVSADVAISAGRVVRVGDCVNLIGPDTEVVGCTGSYLLPGFLDGHLHPENSRLAPAAAAEVLLGAGTTGIVTGFDHVAAASGPAGVRAAIDSATAIGLGVYWASPFRLPYTRPESAPPYTWGGQEHREVMSWPECIGVWELCPGWVDRDDDETWAALDFARARGLGVYGSVPDGGEDLPLVAAHVVAGLRVDHEAYSAAELVEKLRMGLSCLIRDSSVEVFLPILVKVVLDQPHLSHLIGFCTDGFYAAEVLTDGHINRIVRDAVALGVPAGTAVQMASLNTARAYRLDHEIGSITPGRRADILVCDDLVSFVPTAVYAAGRLVASGGRPHRPVEAVASAVELLDAFDRPAVRAEDLVLRTDLTGPELSAAVIEMTDNAFDRRLGKRIVTVVDGELRASPGEDVATVAYVNRHTNARLEPGLGLVAGFGLRGGALATSSTPDDENILCVGTNPTDMAIAINELICSGGGDIVVEDGRIVDMLPLPVHGIMSDLPPSTMVQAQEQVEAAARALGCAMPHPFSFLGILAITGVPEVGMSQHGPVAYATRSVIDVVIDDRSRTLGA